MSTMRRALRRVGPLVAVLALAFAVAAPAASADPRAEATEWLASQLKPTPASNPAHCDSFSPAGIVGQTIDCMLAFKAAGFESQRSTTYAYVLANMDDYVGEESCAEEPASLSAAAVAKLALAVEAQGGNPMDVGAGHRNLIADLQCLQDGEGRFRDISAGEDFSNVFGQSLAIVALRACEEGSCPSEPELAASTINPAGNYLRKQQCAEHNKEGVAGAFRSSLGLDTGECNAMTPFPSETEFNPNAVEVDSTGFAIEALLIRGGGLAKSAAKEAGIWLLANAAMSKSPPRIHWDGYCSFTEPTKKLPSVNSTALAVMGGALVGIEIPPARKWLEDAALSGENRGLPACGASGNGDVIATAQGILGLYGQSYPTMVGLEF